ncbi:MAG: cation diffusion facilitator family transporter [Desulfobacteraceae bacterium]
MDASERVAVYSTALAIFLVTLKYALAVFSGSLALVADAIHSSADVVSSASIWAGIRISRRKSKRFPYGLYKVENLVALVTAGLIFLAGYEIVRTAFGSAEQLQPARLPYAIGGVVLITAILLGFSRYELKKGKELSSPSLVADAQHLTTDLFSSLIILIGLVGGYFQIKYPLDQWAALIIAGLIIWAGLRIAVNAIRVLLDASLDFNTLNNIRELIMETPQVGQIISLTGRNSGPFKFIEVDVSLKVKDLGKAHSLAKQIENRIRNRVSNVDHVVIHYEPIKKETIVQALPLTEDYHHLSEHFGEAPFFLLLTRRAHDRRLLRERLLGNPFIEVPTGKGIKVAEWLLGLGVDEIITGKSFSGKGPFYVFSNANVEMIQTDLRSLDEIKASLLGITTEAETTSESPPGPSTPQ